MGNVIINLQIACIKKIGLPTQSDFIRWIKTVMFTVHKKAEITIRLVDEKESYDLNMKYCNKNYPTNILSFLLDFSLKKTPILGDLVVCRQVIERESKIQKKKLKAHWAHIIIHGSLHLLGFNHIFDAETLKMEKLETKIMKKLGYLDPYSLR